MSTSSAPGPWAISPSGETATGLRKSSWFLVRDARARYTLVRIWDPRQPLAEAPYYLRGCRSIRPSPFPEEAGRVFSFAGFDLTGAAGGRAHLLAAVPVRSRDCQNALGLPSDPFLRK